MIKVRIDVPETLRVESAADMESILAPMRCFLGAIQSHGYAENRAEAGGESSKRTYGSFAELENSLCADFLSEKERLAGTGLPAPDLAYIEVLFTKTFRSSGLMSRLRYSGGEITIDNCEDEDQIYERCCEELQPFLYYK